MTHTPSVSMIDRFEPARALRRSIVALVWQRQGWTFVAFVCWLVSAFVGHLGAAALLYAFAERLSPFVLLWLARTLVVFCAFSLAIVSVIAIRWLFRERLRFVVAEVDEWLKGEDVRNALDLMRLQDNNLFVSTTFAKWAVMRAWQRWQEALHAGAVSALTQRHRQRTLFAFGLAALLSVFALATVKLTSFSLNTLIALYRDAEATMAFNVHGRLHLTVSDADGVVQQGQKVSVSVTAQAPNNLPLPRRLSLQLIWRTNGQNLVLPLKRQQDGVFVGEVTVLQSGTLQAVSGAVRSNLLTLRAQPLPQIREWLVTVEPPAYSGLPAETLVLERWEPLRVLKGSVITIVATASERLQRVEPEAASPFTPPSVRGTEVRWSRRVMTPLRWRWFLVDRFGFTNATEWLTVQVRPDVAPAVRVLPHTERIAASGFAFLTIRAEDDFGVSSLSLQFGLSATKEQLPNAPQLVSLAIAPAPQVEQTLALPVPAEAVGQWLWVRALAADNDTVSGPKTASSSWQCLLIVAPEELLGDLNQWLARLKRWEEQLQKGEWQQLQQEVTHWQAQWQEALQQLQWTQTPLPHHWLADWLAHLQEHLKQRQLTAALEELWTMQRALERALAEQRLTTLAQDLSALRAQQETIHQRLQHHAKPSSLAAQQQRVLERTEQLLSSLQEEARKWEELNEPQIAFALQDVAKVLQQRPTSRAMQQAQGAMEQELRELALWRTSEALADLREAEERLTSPTQSPLAQLYRQERNLLAQLLEQTERLRHDQQALRQETEKASANLPSKEQPATSPSRPTPLTPPPAPPWGEVEQLPLTQPTPSPPPTLQPSLAKRQEQLLQRSHQLQRPLRTTLQQVPQLSPEAIHFWQRATEQMSEALKTLQQKASALPLPEPIRLRATEHQRQAEGALQRLADLLRQALQTDQGTATQRMGAGENEAMALAQRQAQLLRRTQQLHRQRQQGQTPSPSQLRQLGAEEGSIRRSLSRMEGFFGDTLPPELRQQLEQALEHLNWLEQQLPEGETGKPAQSRQQQVLETLLQLAQVLSGQQGNQQGQQQARQGQRPDQPDVNWGRFVEHGPPMREIPEPLRGAKGGAAFLERSNSPSGASQSPTHTHILRGTVPPTYQGAVQRYFRSLR